MKHVEDGLANKLVETFVVSQFMNPYNFDHLTCLFPAPTWGGHLWFLLTLVQATQPVWSVQAMQPRIKNKFSSLLFFQKHGPTFGLRDWPRKIPDIPAQKVHRKCSHSLLSQTHHPARSVFFHPFLKAFTDSGPGEITKTGSARGHIPQ